MKKVFFLVALLFSVLSTCCTHAPVARAPDPTEVKAWADFELTLHVDDGFEPAGRAIIVAAADNIRRLTQGRARLTVVFDADFDSVQNLAAHKAAGHSLVIAVLSDYEIVQTLDASNKGSGQLMAATATMKDGPTIVFLILDRIDVVRAENTVTHEFGHVIGLPDLPELGAIMSGASIKGSPAIPDWTQADIELCRAYRYCA